MSNIITVWQPLYYPRLHYFARLARSDIFVIFDDAEFSRSSPQHRAPIKHQNKNWLTIPISREDTTMPINEAKIDMGKDWINKHLGTFKAKYGGNSADKFNKFYEDIGDNAYLSDITIPIIKSLISSFEIDIDIHLSSETKVDYKKGSPSEYNADLSEHFGADTYYCGE
jgi:hypothetical protein